MSETMRTIFAQADDSTERFVIHWYETTADNTRIADRTRQIVPHNRFATSKLEHVECTVVDNVMHFTIETHDGRKINAIGLEIEIEPGRIIPLHGAPR